MRFGFFVVLVFSFLGCGGSPTEPEAPTRTIETPQMLISGCRVRTETSCERLVLPTSRDTKIWLDLVPSAEVSVQLDGRPLEFSSEAAERGTVLTLALPLRSGRLSIQGVAPQWTQAARIEIEWRAPPLTVLLARYAARQHFPPRVLLSAVQVALAFETSPRRRVDLLNAVRWLAERLGRYGLVQEAQREAVELARASGFGYDVAELTLIEGFSYERRGDVTSARDALEQVRSSPALPLELEGSLGYQQGLLEVRLGNHAAAVRNFAAVMRGAERLQSHLLFFASLQMLAISTSELGDERSALGLIEEGFDSLHLLRDDCPNRAKTLGNLGWALLRLAEDGVAIERARVAFVDGLEASTRLCADESGATNLRVNLALAALLDWEPEEALFHVAEVRTASPSRGGREWIDAIDARARHLAGRALGSTSPLVTRDRFPRDPFLAWDAAVLDGERLRAAGLPAAAVEYYQDAEQVLAKASETLGAATVQESFLARRDDSLEGLLGSLLDSDQPREAVCHARLAIRRTLLRSDRAARIDALDDEKKSAWDAALGTYLKAQRTLARDAASDWKHEVAEVARRRSARAVALLKAESRLTKIQSELLGSLAPSSCEDLPPRVPQDALLVGYFGAEESIVFVVSESGVRWSRGGSPAGDADAWAREVLGPLELETLGVDTIRLLITGRGQSLPWPSLPVGTGQMVDVAALEWGLDLPDQDATEARSTAVVIGDPTGDLPEARAEADSTADSLRSAGWSVTHLERGEAQADRVRMLLLSASLVYFAGHGRRSSETAGGLGWSDALVLADGQLTVPEILGLERVPARVVVTGCDSGTTSQSGLSGGLNVGRAFLLAGAEQVLVASGKADDVEARIIGNEVAKALATRPSLSLAQALQTAQYRLRDEQPGSHWWQYRVLVR